MGSNDDAPPAIFSLPPADPTFPQLQVIAAYDIFPQDHFVGLEYLHAARQEHLPFVLYHHAPRATLHAAEAFQVMQKAKDLGALYISFPYNATLGAAGVMHEGPISFMQGLPGISYLAEELIVSRDIELVRAVRHKVHFHQVSGKRSLELIRRAKQEGLPITCGTSAAHLLYTEQAVADFNVAAKYLPPLRTEEDRQALIAAVKDHTLDCLSLGHYGTRPTQQDFMQAPFTGLPPGEALPQLYQQLVKPGLVALDDILRLWHDGPAAILRGTAAENTLAPTTTAPSFTWDLGC
ncbi:MAG: hypothetical protein J6Y94_02855, partial [Bacteriovoracaceae bacterium]|nr:hypothetical protein [Bacteriovoracaceae bacterium]